MSQTSQLHVTLR